jgi:hypothetical protein
MTAWRSASSYEMERGCGEILQPYHAQPRGAGVRFASEMLCKHSARRQLVGQHPHLFLLGIRSFTRFLPNACTEELSSARIGRLTRADLVFQGFLCCCLARLLGLLPPYQLGELPPAVFHL